MLIILNLQNLLPLIFQSQYQPPKLIILLLGIYRQVLPGLVLLLLHQPPLPGIPPPLPHQHLPLLSQPLPLRARCNHPRPISNQQPEPAPRPRRSPRLNPGPDRACVIKSPPRTPPHHTSEPSRMARTYPLTVSFNECLGSRANSLSFANLHLVDLRNGQSQYLSTVKQLVDALPKTENTSSRFALQGHIARPGQKRLRHSMRAAVWWLLPSNGIFRRSSDSLRHFLTYQGWRVVLRGGDVTLPPFERYLNWVNDPTPPPYQYHGDLTSPALQEITSSTKKIRRLRTPSTRLHGSYSHADGRRNSLGQRLIRILRPGRLEAELSVSH